MWVIKVGNDRGAETGFWSAQYFNGSQGDQIGEFPHIGRLFTSRSFIIAPKFWLLFDKLTLTKMGWASFWAIFDTGSSGHPVGILMYAFKRKINFVGVFASALSFRTPESCASKTPALKAKIQPTNFQF
jgi:hypothetical protein